MIQINLVSDGSAYAYAQTVALDGELYRFRLIFNSRVGVWTLTVTADDGEILISGRPITLAVDLFRYATRRPRGRERAPAPRQPLPPRRTGR